jgi:hypothetical protein
MTKAARNYADHDVNFMIDAEERRAAAITRDRS